MSDRNTTTCTCNLKQTIEDWETNQLTKSSFDIADQSGRDITYSDGGPDSFLDLGDNK